MAKVKLKGNISPNILLIFGVFGFAYLIFTGFRNSINSFIKSIPDAFKLKDPKLLSDLGNQLLVAFTGSVIILLVLFKYTFQYLKELKLGPVKFES